MTSMAITERPGDAHDSAVLHYYAREALEISNAEHPCGGLPLGAFRAARARLLAAGALVHTTDGRYVPVQLAQGESP